MRSLRATRYVGSLTVFAVVVAFGSSAFGVGPLDGDVNAIPGFTGSQAFSVTNNGDLLEVDVDYAVFAPGDYPGAGVAGTDPSGGGDYVYAYQAYVSTTGNVGMSQLSLGLLDDDFVNPQPDPLNVAFYDTLHETTGGDVPSNSFLMSASVLVWWRFTTSEVSPGDHSVVVLITSDFGPTFEPASVTGGGMSAQETLPSPLPEPTTVALMGLGAVVMLRRRQVRGSR